jgi:hypothetical protein
MALENKKELSPEQPVLPSGRREEQLRILKARFEKNMNHHIGVELAKVLAKLEAYPDRDEKLWSLNETERTGGEPDVVVPLVRN